MFIMVVKYHKDPFIAILPVNSMSIRTRSKHGQSVNQFDTWNKVKLKKRIDQDQV